ncbi:unnamed protein product [Brassica rapa subsp. narinosa]
MFMFSIVLYITRPTTLHNCDVSLNKNSLLTLLNKYALIVQDLILDSGSPLQNISRSNARPLRRPIRPIHVRQSLQISLVH